MVHGRGLWGSAAGTGSGRSDKVNYPPGDRGRTGTAEKEDVDGDGRKVIWIIKIMHLYRLQIILQQRIF